MLKNKKTKFEQLKAKWYKKLEKSGFEDIESDENNLKVWSSIFARKNSPEVWQARAEYYQMATNFLEDYKFSNDVEKIVWEYHSNGISMRDISKLLKKARVKSIPINRQDIGVLIRKLKNSMYSMYVAKQDEYHE